MNSVNNSNISSNFNTFYNFENKFAQNGNTSLIAQTKPDTFEKSAPAVINTAASSASTSASVALSAQSPSVPGASAENTALKQAKSDKTSLIIGGIAATAGLILGGILLHKKFSADKVTEQIQKILPEHIDFTAAANKDEAIKFGMEILGIKTYAGFEDGDIKVLNWINEGLTNVSNKTKGKAKMPGSIYYDADIFTNTIGENALAAAVSVLDSEKCKNITGDNILAVNKKWFGNPVESLKTVIEKNIKANVLKKTEGGYELSQLFMKNDRLSELLDKFENGNPDFNEQILLFDTLRKYRVVLTSVVNSPLHTYRQIAGSEEGLKAMEKLSYADQKAAVLKILNSPEFNVKIDVRNLETPFETIYHEMGHIQDKVKRVAPSGKFKSRDDYPAALKEWLDNSSNMEIANSISPYAASGPGEFIAETFAKVMNGAHVSDEAKKLYLKLGGSDMIF